MAHFFGSLKGSRGRVTRLGTAKSGIEAEARGWSIGGLVEASTVGGDRDIIRLSLNGGSGDSAILWTRVYCRKGGILYEVDGDFWNLVPGPGVP